MKRSFLRLIPLIVSIFAVFTASAQIVKPATWKFTSKKFSDCEYELQITGTISEGWHIYSLNQAGDDGPQPSNLVFEKSKAYELIGKPTEGAPIKAHDKVFDMDVAYFEKTVTFKQKIKLLTDKSVTIKGNLEYQACTEVNCVFETNNPYEFTLTGTAACLSSASTSALPSLGAKEACVCDSNAIYQALAAKKNGADTITVSAKATTEAIPSDPPSTKSDDDTGYWGLIIKGFLGGLAALLTPCVFPMIPLTVSFFLKQSKTRAQGIRNALLYGISIIVIYISLGFGVSLIFGSDVLNDLSTTVGFNLFFFLLLMIFAASFLGAFEIALPSTLVNKIDQQSDRGGIAGIFFMAMTLAVVSFSCTAPVVGSLLVDAAVNGGIKGPLCGMFGFAFALALPFALFALFPTWLNQLPKSGGWLNSVKVFLGFLELAFALKFASNADLVVQAHILTREIFIALWVIIFGLLGAYLMGWFKLSHDSDLKHVSVPRLLIAIISFAFTVYMIPGLWGAPLKLINGFTPPDFYTESPGGFGSRVTPTVKGSTDHKEEHCPNQLPCFHDYNEALAYAQKVHKPLLIDFTGWACNNCRKMESDVWTNPEVDKRLRNDVVLVSLYVDDKTSLPEAEQETKKLGDRTYKIKTIGNKWSFMQASRYQTNSQPQYILVDNKEAMLTKETTSYNPSAELYIDWLDRGIKEFKNRK